MDKSTHKIRLEQWTAIVNECLSSGLNKTEWCRQNGINDKVFFYWQRRVRENAASSKKEELVPVLAELPEPKKHLDNSISMDTKSHVVLRSGSMSIDIPYDIPDEFLVKIMRLMSNA